MILVVGSTGVVGSDICRRLVAAGQPVRALVRTSSDPARVAAMQGLGIEIVTGDLTQPETLVPACQGIESVICSISGVANGLLAAARLSGVGRLVYISVSFAVDGGPITAAKRNDEQAIAASGLPFTILRPTYFMETWLSARMGFDYENSRALFYGPGDSPVSWVAAGDVARFAVLSLNHPAAQNAIFEIGGPQTLSQRDVTRIFEQTTGKPFEIQMLSEARLDAAISSAGGSELALACLKRSLARGDAIDMRDLLQTFPIDLVTVQDYAWRVLGDVADQRHTSEVLRQLRELTDFMVDAIGSGRRGFDYGIKEYVLMSNNELSRAFSEYIRRLGLGDEWERPGTTEEQDRLSAKIRTEALRAIAEQIHLPEMDRWVKAVLRSQDERISIYKNLAQQAELLNQ